jgi:hypothetical protein
MLAPAVIASSASSRDWHSTLMSSEKPATRRTDLTADVIEPVCPRSAFPALRLSVVECAHL